MKNPVANLLLAALVAAPTIAFAAQPDSSLTRAQVIAELVQLEKAGFNPNGDKNHYPEALQAAQARVAAAEDMDGMGSETRGTSESGARPAVSAAELRALYRGH
ncbi:DUF4148 domain-containing protein [Burkholderia gladioli]|uniref:DUF4148 domain-containing protein n=1 Tax=Burkholderia gladioli TaxID=28095 RepID=UPI00264E8FAA|nr:DUF4148 domain-containing protein [Burkholderia gladioli]MDN7750654.1 DUF4148 domain-containing protein [Burkholderia gladioli]